ncbi:hypothetical protein J1605_011835 [Eschrichtius robustus]|uniref:Apple domain-containing protein n=1 Tax=Eschrichtius robustus TaxID=9764 RepID=A0AB34GMI6_ESCRO|nr:hypothetical protein J1605_011835 [Eschrichtius robustus]
MHVRRPGCSMKRASSLNVLNVGGTVAEDHFQCRDHCKLASCEVLVKNNSSICFFTQERNNCLADSRALSASHADLAPTGRGRARLTPKANER